MTGKSVPMLLTLLGGLMSSAILLADAPSPSVAPAANQTTAAPPKTHHKHKKKTAKAPPPIIPTIVPATKPAAGIPPAAAGAPDLMKPEGSGNPGSPNISGTGDHTPGTTGTSGQ